MFLKKENKNVFVFEADERDWSSVSKKGSFSSSFDFAGHPLGAGWKDAGLHSLLSSENIRPH